MVVTDPIADFIIRIKNASLARRNLVEVRWSKMKENLAEILVKEGYLAKASTKIDKSKFKILELELKYKDKNPILNDVKRISKPGVRFYAKAKKTPQVRKGWGGITIISTSAGLMTGLEAKKRNLGGEVICQIW
jgi:small subunit ribosomal protein S8